MKFFILYVLSALQLFAVITIAPVNIGDKKGYSGMIKGSLETKRGNSDVDNYAGGIRIQYDDGKDYTVWSDAVFAYGQASGETNTNKTYIHLRLVHTFLDIKEINSEGFLQSETNEFTNVKRRLILGGGLRYHKDMKKYGNLYFGLGAFVENIEYLTAINPSEYNLRLNSYMSYTKSFNKQSKLSYVLYYQPKVTYISDYILSSGLELEVLIYEKLYVNFMFYYDVDTQPAIGIEDTDVSQRTSLIYKF